MKIAVITINKIGQTNTNIHNIDADKYVEIDFGDNPTIKKMIIRKARLSDV